MRRPASTLAVRSCQPSKVSGAVTCPVSRRAASTSTSYSSSPSSPDVAPLPASPKPPVPTWYTGRPALSAFLASLQETLAASRRSLYRQGYLSSVDQDAKLAAALLPASSASANTAPRWLTQEDMASKLSVGQVRLAAYRRITTLLAELHTLHPLMAECSNLPRSPLQAAQVQEVRNLIAGFSKMSTKTASQSTADGESELGVVAAESTERKNRQHGYLDPLTGVSYGLGRKKTSSARAWIVPVQSTSNTPSTTSTSAELASEEDASLPPIGSILVNALPLTTFFPEAAQRSVITRPFSLTETLGRFNVFVLVHGGGVSSQAQAAAVAISRALGTTDQEGTRRAILSKADLLRRDPRVVERKKTGRPKARKRFTWVKR